MDFNVGAIGTHTYTRANTHTTNFPSRTN